MRALLIWPLLAILALPVWADARMSVLVDVLKLREAAYILRAEGLAYADDLDSEMLDGQGGAGWQLQVNAIYDPERLVEEVRQALEGALQGQVLEDTIRFFASDLGQEIVTLENSARLAIGEQDVEDAARGRYLELSETDDPRLAQVMEFADTGDMLNRNVTSAMNSNYQFLRGLADGHAIEMTEQEILADVAGDIDEITDDTTSWLYGYFLLAYHPLADDDLQRYIAFANTPAGQALNRALFEGFGKAYEDISYALGRAVALNMLAEEL